MRVAARWLSVIIQKPCGLGCPALNVSIRPQQRYEGSSVTIPPATIPEPHQQYKKRQQLTGGSEAVEMILQAIKLLSSYFKELMASSSIADIVLV